MLRVSLHCLIYKVHAALRRELYCTTSWHPCQALFHLFDFFLPFGSQAPQMLQAVIQVVRGSHELLYLSTPLSLCQHLFSTFSIFSVNQSLSCCLSKGAQLIYQTLPALSTPFFNFFAHLFLFFLFAFPFQLWYACIYII